MSVHPLLQTRVVLLDFVSDGRESFKKKVKFEYRSNSERAQKAVDLEDVAVREIPLVISAEGPQTNSSAVEGINESEAVKLAGVDQIKRNLSGGIEIVACRNSA